MSQSKFFLWSFVLTVFIGSVGFFFYHATSVNLNHRKISKLIGPAIAANNWPKTAVYSKGNIKTSLSISYTTDAVSQEAIQKLFNAYKPDYGALVAMDAETGRILSMVSYTRDNEPVGNLSLRATFPAASVFKLITATAAVESAQLTPETMIAFSGGSHTLYRRNVYDKKINRWTRNISLKQAFALSVNTVFAKLGLEHMAPSTLAEYAHRFKFNQDIDSDIPVQPSVAKIPDEATWEIAEVASGFNKVNTLSPLHGAMLAAAVVNDGVMMTPYLVDSMQNEDGETVYSGVPKIDSVIMEPKTAEKIKILMAETVKSGTSRKMFRDLVRSPAYDRVSFGGKSGSMTGLDPQGKTDWFVGYAQSGDRKIAVSVMTIHKKNWTVRSAYLVRRYIQSYLENNGAIQAESKTSRRSKRDRI
ncbi:MAG: penicillin-binding transpeptidase domain-containing protein [Bdellovibrionales bacterium]